MIDVVMTAAKDVIPYHMLNSSETHNGTEQEATTTIDGFACNYEKLLVYSILKMYGLYNIAKNENEPPVELAITLDGADLSRLSSHVTAGIKILDLRAVDPVTKIPIGLLNNKKSTIVQSVKRSELRSLKERGATELT